MGQKLQSIFIPIIYNTHYHMMCMHKKSYLIHENERYIIMYKIYIYIYIDGYIVVDIFFLKQMLLVIEMHDYCRI
jgi:hypothetical protein